MKTRVPATEIKVGDTIEVIGDVTAKIEWVRKWADGGMSLAGVRSNGEAHTNSLTAGAKVTRIDPDPVEKIEVPLRRERIIGRGQSFNKNTTEEYRLRSLQNSVFDDRDGPFGDPGWKTESLEIVATRDHPENHKRPEHNQMVIVLAKLVETKTELI